jgi:pimeloyl-ACP methyl ester carboxylesterase
MGSWKIEPGSGEYVDADGIRTYYVKRGSGPAIVLLHGQAPGASVHVNWDHQIDFFARQGFTVYAFDGVGFGRSDHSDDYTRERRVRHARGFLDALDIDRCTLWGQSDGSNLSCRIALDGDPRVERLVLQASGSLSPRPPSLSEEEQRRQAEVRESYQPSLQNARKELERSLVNKAAITDEFVAEFYAMSTGKNHEAFKARHAIPTKPIYDELHRITVPTLIVWGNQDSGGPERGLLLFQKFRGAELHIFDDCGHWVEVDQTDRLNSLVLNFLGGAGA